MFYAAVRRKQLSHFSLAIKLSLHGEKNLVIFCWKCVNAVVRRIELSHFTATKTAQPCGQSPVRYPKCHPLLLHL